jgi:hypothetical protein
LISELWFFHSERTIFGSTNDEFILCRKMSSSEKSSVHLY